MWHGCRQLTVLNKYENKYELKAAANESKSKPNVGKGIASPSLVPGAEERGKGVPGVYCLHMWSILGTPGHLRYTNFCESAVFSPCRRCILPTML